MFVLKLGSSGNVQSSCTTGSTALHVCGRSKALPNKNLESMIVDDNAKTFATITRNSKNPGPLRSMSSAVGAFR